MAATADVLPHLHHSVPPSSMTLELEPRGRPSLAAVLRHQEIAA